MTLLTQNFADLKAQVEAHVKTDALIQGEYWMKGKGCFIGCLSHSSDPMVAVRHFGLTEHILRIAENIFESLSANEAKAFFAALPDAVGCDGKDLSLVHWQFLAAELRALPEQSASIQAVIEPVIEGMDLLASGKEWAADAAHAAANAAHAAANAAIFAAYEAADAAAYAANAAYEAAHAADYAADAANAARYAAYEAAHAARLRQRDTLLRLISEAPVKGEE